MAKLMLTTFCNQDCSYCFARKNLNTKTQELSLNLLERFLSLSQRDPLILSGGEPVLHSRFSDILSMINSKNRKVVILTNGAYDSQLLENAPLAQVRRVLLNVSSHPMDKVAHENIGKNIEILLKRKIIITLGHTLSSTSTKMDFIYSLLDSYPIKAVRLSLANPSVSNSLSKKKIFEDFIASLSDSFRLIVKALNKKGIIPTIDCGVPLCIVPKEQYSDFRRRTFWNQSCASDLNLFPDGKLYHCHCSFDYTYPLEEINRARTIAKEREESLRWKNPPMQRCLSCDYWKDRKCRGGCLGWRLKNNN